jgi:hypothetical protein
MKTPQSPREWVDYYKTFHNSISHLIGMNPVKERVAQDRPRNRFSYKKKRAQFRKKVGVSPVEYTKEYHSGLKKLRKFYKIILKDEKKPFEKHQFEIVRGCTPMILKMAYGNRFFFEHLGFLKKKFRLDHMKTAVLVVLKRQVGKTETMVRMISAAVVCFDNVDFPEIPFELPIVSYKGDHAKEIMERCYHYLISKKELIINFRIDGNRIKTLKSLKLVNKHNSQDVRRVYVVEGKIDGLAGKTYFFDEYFKAKEQIAVKDLLPQLMVDGTAILAMTTLHESGHWRERFLENENDLFHMIYKANICKQCLKLPPQQMIKCDHMEKIQTSFIDIKKMKAISMLMSDEQIMSELYNVIIKSSGQVWSKEFINSKFVAGTFDEKKCNGIYYMFCDPSMTSTASNEKGSYTASALIYEDTDGTDYLCSIDHEKTDCVSRIWDSILKHLRHAFNTVKPTPKYIVLFVEHNTINYGVELEKAIYEDRDLFDRVIFFRGINTRAKNNTDWRYGVTKRAHDDERFMAILNEKMYMDKFFIHARCSTPNEVQTLDSLITELKRQVCNVRFLNGRVTSKYNNNKKKDIDDMYITITSAIYNIRRIKNPNYREWFDQLLNRQTVSYTRNLYRRT